jgi:hydroxyethylthiazole kinase-like uncharacterized protein yjeF
MLLQTTRGNRPVDGNMERLPPGIAEFAEAGIISHERMRVVDANARALGLSSIQMMESAGRALAESVRAADACRVLILCGKGNNGGDGMVAARYLQDLELDVCVVSGSGMTNETAEQLQLLSHCQISVHSISCRDDVRALGTLFSHVDIILDALLGTGLKGAVKEPVRTCIELANQSPAKILCADVPTPGIRADLILAFHRPKVDGSFVAGIGIPLEAEIFTGPGDLLLIKKRRPDAHKGNGGEVLIVGGGPYQGAPYLCGLGALRAGADIVRIASPIFEPVPDLIYERLEGKIIEAEHIEQILRLIDHADVVVLGTGLGDKSHHVIRALAPHCKKAVFDADALRKPFPKAADSLYTPHGGEFERMIGKRPEEDLVSRAKSVRDSGIPGTILLKGPGDIISEGTRVRFNRTGTPLMTVGGTGDVLAGVTGALFCEMPAFDAACIAAYVNGRAGMALEKERAGGMLASDLPPYISLELFGRGGGNGRV